MPNLPDSSIIQSIGNAIAIQEGYGASASNKPTRTKNPGNLGNTDDGSTRTYPTPEDGYNALYQQVQSMFDGSSKIYNQSMTLAQVGKHYASDPNWAAGVANALGVSPDTTLADIGVGKSQINLVPQPYATGDFNGGTGAVISDQPYLTVDDSDPVVAQPVSGMSIPGNQLSNTLNAIAPSLIIHTGIEQAAWYQDKGILPVDDLTRGVDYPVKFQVFFDKEGSPLPVVITLVASVRTIQKTMRHQINRRPTRTGRLIDLWGSVPDTLTGTASTGLMANQLGITDYLSLTSAPESVKDQVLQAFRDPTYVDSDVQEALLDQPGYFRQAAKDAFMEFLSLFKNEATVWFQNENYTGVTTDMEQTGVDAWSPVTGSSTFQNTSRRNMVMARGQVVMYYRNTQYAGYFKSLNLTMDAKNPFRWNFNFVFQVESTRIES